MATFKDLISSKAGIKKTLTILDSRRILPPVLDTGRHDKLITIRSAFIDYFQRLAAFFGAIAKDFPLYPKERARGRREFQEPDLPRKDAGLYLFRMKNGICL
jgi:hypothetical protein